MIWLIGARGMLGQQIGQALRRRNTNVVATDQDVDITDFDALHDFARSRSFRWIINCAAYTAVDQAESEPNKTRQINVEGSANIARIAHQLGATLVHFSTDFIFDGQQQQPYRETDPPNPLSVYGQTKLDSEIEIQKNHDAYLVIRISWLYGIFGSNFVKTMVRLCAEKDQLTVVSDQIGAPTYAAPLATQIVDIVLADQQAYGIYHYADDASISWYDFAVAIQEFAFQSGYLRRIIPIRPIVSAEYPTAAKRPPFSVLDTTKIQTVLGFRVYDWRDNLAAFFHEWSPSQAARL